MVLALRLGAEDLLCHTSTLVEATSECSRMIPLCAERQRRVRTKLLRQVLHPREPFSLVDMAELDECLDFDRDSCAPFIELHRAIGGCY